jgi:hypothetical protein
MAFHRFAVPSYTGGLPPGYDYINNATSGTPAPADGALGAGPNAGSYFFGSGEQATAAAWNRAAKALAENTDTLDDLLHRDLAVPRIQDFPAAGAPVSQIVLTGPGVFIGKPGTPNTVAGIGTFVQITDQNDNEIVNSGVECKVTAISDTVGSGFSAGNVTLTVSPAIPAGIAYRVYFATHGNLASLPVDALTSIRLGSAEEVPAELLASSGASLIGYSGSGNWADGTNVAATNVAAALDEIVADLAATAGAGRIGADPNVGTYVFGTLGTSVQAQLDEISNYLDLGPAGRLVQTYTNASSPVTLTTQRQIVADTSGGPITFNLPAAASGREYWFKDPKGTWNANPITLVPSGGAKIENVAGSRTFYADFGSFRIFCDGTDWFIG